MQPEMGFEMACGITSGYIFLINADLQEGFCRGGPRAALNMASPIGSILKVISGT